MLSRPLGQDALVHPQKLAVRQSHHRIIESSFLWILSHAMLYGQSLFYFYNVVPFFLLFLLKCYYLEISRLLLTLVCDKVRRIGGFFWLINFANVQIMESRRWRIGEIFYYYFKFTPIIIQFCLILWSCRLLEV